MESKKRDTNFFCRIEIDSQTSKINLWLPKGKRWGGINLEMEINRYRLLLLLHWGGSSCCEAQSCPNLCDPIDGSPPGSPIPGILQSRTLEWVAISFSNAWKWKVKVKLLSCVQLLVTPWTAAYQAPPPMGFSRQEYWSGLPFSSTLIWLVHRKNIFPRTWKKEKQKKT